MIQIQQSGSKHVFKLMQETAGSCKQMQLHSNSIVISSRLMLLCKLDDNHITNACPSAFENATNKTFTSALFVSEVPKYFFSCWGG